MVTDLVLVTISGSRATLELGDSHGQLTMLPVFTLGVFFALAPGLVALPERE